MSVLIVVISAVPQLKNFLFLFWSFSLFVTSVPYLQVPRRSLLPTFYFHHFSCSRRFYFIRWGKKGKFISSQSSITEIHKLYFFSCFCLSCCFAEIVNDFGFFFWSLNMLWFRDWHAPNFLFIFLALFYFLNLYFFESNYEIFSLSLLLLLLLPSFYFKSLVNLSLMQV